MKSLVGTGIKVVSDQNVEVAGMPRHVRDLRVVATPPPLPAQKSLAMDKQSVSAEDDEFHGGAKGE